MQVQMKLMQIQQKALEDKKMKKRYCYLMLICAIAAAGLSYTLLHNDTVSIEDYTSVSRPQYS